MNSNGEVQLASNGVAICTDAGYQHSPRIISDGLGGAIITWADYRSGTNYDVYANRVAVSAYKTKVGNAGCWRWGYASYPSADAVLSGSATYWQWLPWVPGSGRKVPQGGAGGWGWGNE